MNDENNRHDSCPDCNIQIEPHTCPYKVDVEDDYEECTCCEKCQDECADDI